MNRTDEERGVDTGAAEKRLRTIPNVGPAMARDLILIGITRVEDAVGRDPDEMYERLCALEGVRQDPCVRDVFASVVAYAEGGPSKPWWAFTPERKARDVSKKKSPGARP
ncbi:MAG: mitomycin resistance protein [Chloroflexi bacterium]|nr:MAG: mitomycin resistance protein [Chloroflexota bacterium]